MVTLVEPLSAGRPRSHAVPSPAASRRPSVSSAVTVEKPAVAGRPEEPVLTRPPLSTRGAASSGPYVVKPPERTPRPARSSSRQ
ncbi:hypothetical protein [Streptomyces tagetis]|uniref:Uncharacterized protein n=1 Tax=Streptomyces tagetis TaxID=2820809 RepID=A0A940XT72_9ACTN|nr:hypothetical protein [Streptomyces sp. RG38]